MATDYLHLMMTIQIIYIVLYKEYSAESPNTKTTNNKYADTDSDSLRYVEVVPKF